MRTPAFQQQDCLLKIAQEDMVYCTWEKSFENCREAFMRFADTQPEEVRSILYGYADCGRMAQQRLVNLACENMIFPCKKPNCRRLCPVWTVRMANPYDVL